MTPTEPQANEPGRRESALSSNPNKARPKWSLNQQAFDRLLASFSEDRDEAGRQFEVTRTKLVRFFEWRSCCLAEELADETMNRVARKIDEGQVISNLPAYAYGVARMVFMEALKDQERAPLPLETTAATRSEPLWEDDEPDARLRCFDRCLEELPAESRILITEYYQEEKRAKIELRKQLADRLSIPLNALRIRAYRIRATLEKCVTLCLDQHA